MEQLSEALGSLIRRKNSDRAFSNLTRGLATNISESEGTFTLVREGEDDYPNVRLNAYYLDAGYLLLIPKEESVVVVGFADDSTSPCLVQVSEIQKIIGKIGDFELVWDKDSFQSKNTDSEIIQTKEKTQIKKGQTLLEVQAQGLSVKRNGENLKACVNDYLTEVDKIIIVQGTNLDKVATAQIRNRINTILC